MGATAGGLRWFNAMAKAAVKRGLPFFPRPARCRDPASAGQGQVTTPIRAEAVRSHNAQLICSVCAHGRVRIERDRRRWVVVTVVGWGCSTDFALLHLDRANSLQVQEPQKN